MGATGGERDLTEQELLEIHRRHSHDGKRPLTKGSAIAAMYAIADRTGEWIAAYPCGFSAEEHWHVGSFEKIAQNAGLKPRTTTTLNRPQYTVGVRQTVGSALGNLEAELRQLYPDTPASRWEDHLRVCGRCAQAFPDGRRLCRYGERVYWQCLLWRVAREKAWQQQHAPQAAQARAAERRAQVMRCLWRHDYMTWGRLAQETDWRYLRRSLGYLRSHGYIDVKRMAGVWVYGLPPGPYDHYPEEWRGDRRAL